jgi:hypothetical protein
MATNGPASFYEISSLTRKSRVDTNLLPTAATSTWGISSYVGPLQLHVIRIHCGPEIMNVRNSVSPIFERILKRKQNTLRISVQKTRFCFTNTWTKERLFIRTPWRQRLWENWRYSSIHLQSWLRAANGQFYVPAVVPTEYEAAWTARPVWTLRWTLLSLPRNERRFIGRPARISHYTEHVIPSTKTERVLHVLNLRSRPRRTTQDSLASQKPRFFLW